MITLLFMVIFLLVLGFLVVVHELGHFFAARWCGVTVEEFSFGFPPRIWKHQDGPTTWSIGAIPLGGFVRLRGEEGEVKDETSYAGQTAAKRAFIVSAGVLMNLVLALVLLIVWFTFIAIVPPKDALMITDVMKNSSAEHAGLQAGDLIIAIENQPVADPAQLKQATKNKENQPIDLEIRRFGRNRDKHLTLGSGDAPLGVAIEKLAAAERPDHFYQAPVLAVQAIWNVISTTLSVLGAITVGWVTNHQAAEQASQALSGPIGIYGIVSQMISLGFFFVLRLVALLSLSLAVFNILPIPALDGGRLLFIVLERLFGRRVIREQAEQVAHAVGFAFLLSLIVLISFRDLIKLIKG